MIHRNSENFVLQQEQHQFLIPYLVLWHKITIDDYTSIHTRCRPTTDKTSEAKSMCTIIIKVFKNIKALPACLPTDYHNMHAIDIETCIKTVSGPLTMHKLILTYSSSMPGWIRTSFFNAELERQWLASHEYCERDLLQSMSQSEGCHPCGFCTTDP